MSNIAKPFTVISFNENTGQSFADHVSAINGIVAFWEAARLEGRETMVVALPGHLTEGEGQLIFPGESLVEAETIRSQPEVFATGPADLESALSEEDLTGIGYEFSECPDQPGHFLWKLTDGDGSEISYETKDAAVVAAGEHAKSTLDLHRCDDCGKLYRYWDLHEIRHYGERVTPGGVVPSGQCECGALCYPLED